MQQPFQPSYPGLNYKQLHTSRPDLSQSSSNGIELDFVARNAFQQASDIGNKYSDFKRFYSNSSSQQANLNIQPAQMQTPSATNNFSEGKNHQMIKQAINSVFNDFSMTLDQATASCGQVMAQGQQEIFQLSTKYQASSQLRNETLGLWIEAKSQITSYLQEIKDKLVIKQSNAEQLFGVSYPEYPQQTMPTTQKNHDNRLLTELSNFEQFSAKSLTKIENLQDSFEQIDSHLREQKLRMNNLISELCNNNHGDEISKSAGKVLSQRERYLSPFQRKLNSGANPQQLSVLSGQKREKSMQKQKQTTSQNKLTKPPSNFQQTLQSEQLDRLRHLNQTLEKSEHQHQKVKGDLYQIVQSVLQQNLIYCQRLTPLAASNYASQGGGAPHGQQMKDLSYNNEQLYQELRLCQDKYTDLVVENEKLRETLLKLKQPCMEQDFRQESADLCAKVTKFMQCMRVLQKAVNRQQQDVTTQKQDFEESKTSLQSLVTKVQQKLEEPLAVQPLKSAPDRCNSPQREGSSRENKKPTVSSSQLNKLPALLQNIKNLKLEKQKLQELVQALKDTALEEQEKYTKKLFMKSTKIQKYAAQCSHLQLEKQAKEALILELKQQSSSQVQAQISVLEQHFMESLEKQKEQLPDQFKLDPQIQAVKHELVQEIHSCQSKLDTQVSELCQQLQTKEESLQKVKLLFVQKLHELEGSFAEITQTVQEASIQQESTQQSHQVKQAVFSALQAFEEADRQVEFDQLLKRNDELESQIAQLKSQTTESQENKFQTELVIDLQEQLDQTKSELAALVKEKTLQEQEFRKENQTLKYNHKRCQMDLKDTSAKLEKTVKEYQEQFKALKMATLQKQQQLEKSEQSLQELKQQALQTAKDRQELQVTAKGMQQELEEKTQQLMQLQEDFNDSIKVFDQLSQEKAQLEADGNEYKALAEEYQSCYQNQAEELQQKEGEIQQLSQQVSEERDEKESIKQELEVTLADCDKLQKNQQQLQDQVNELKKMIDDDDQVQFDQQIPDQISEDWSLGVLRRYCLAKQIDQNEENCQVNQDQLTELTQTHNQALEQLSQQLKESTEKTSQLQAQLSELENSLEKVSTELSDSNQKCSDLEEQLTSSSQTLAQVQLDSETREQQHEEELQQNHEKVETLTNENETLVQQLDEVRKEIQGLKLQHQEQVAALLDKAECKLQQQQQELQNQLSQAQSQHNSSRTELDSQLQRSLKQLKESEHREGLQQKLLVCLHIRVREVYERKVTAFETELSDLQAALSKLESEIEVQVSARQQIEQQVTSERSNRSAQETELHTLTEQLNQLKQNYSQANSQLTQLEQSHSTVTQQLDHQKELNSQLEKQLSTSQQNYEDCLTQVKDLESQNKTKQSETETQILELTESLSKSKQSMVESEEELKATLLEFEKQKESFLTQIEQVKTQAAAQLEQVKNESKNQTEDLMQQLNQSQNDHSRFQEQSLLKVQQIEEQLKSKEQGESTEIQTLKQQLKDQTESNLQIINKNQNEITELNKKLQEKDKQHKDVQQALQEAAQIAATEVIQLQEQIKQSEQQVKETNKEWEGEIKKLQEAQETKMKEHMAHFLKLQSTIKETKKEKEELSVNHDKAIKELQNSHSEVLKEKEVQKAAELAQLESLWLKEKETLINKHQSDLDSAEQLHQNQLFQVEAKLEAVEQANQLLNKEKTTLDAEYKALNQEFIDTKSVLDIKQKDEGTQLQALTKEVQEARQVLISKETIIDQLQASLEALEIAKKEQVREFDQQINDFKTKFQEQADSHRAERKKHQTELQQASQDLATQAEQHQVEMIKLETTLHSKLEEKSINHSAEVQKIKDMHKGELESLVQSHKLEVQQIQEQASVNLSQVESELAAQLKQLNQVSAQHKEDLATLKVEQETASKCEQKLKKSQEELELSLAKVGELEKRLQRQSEANCENQTEQMQRLGELEQSSKEKDDEIDQLLTTVKTLKAEVDQAKTSLESTIQTQNAELQEKTDEIKLLRDELNQEQMEHRELRQELDSCIDQVKQAQQLVSLKESEFESQSQEIQAQREEYDSQVNQLQDQLSSFYNSRDEGTKSITKMNLLNALQKHLINLLREKSNNKSQEIENLSIFNETLEQNASKAEFRQVQLEGDLKTAKDTIDNLSKQSHQFEEDQKVMQESWEHEQKLNENLNYELQSLKKEMLQLHEELGIKEKELEAALKGDEAEQIKDLLDEKVQHKQIIADLNDQVSELAAKLKEATQQPAKGRDSWGSDGGHHSRGSWGSGGGITQSAEIEEHLKHIRSIMIQFLSQLPPTHKANEDILPILYSMLNFSKAEITEVTTARDALVKQAALASQTKDKTSKGIASFFGGGKKQNLNTSKEK